MRVFTLIPFIYFIMLLLALLLALSVILILWRYYEPKIDVVILVKHYRIYLQYNKWNGSGYKERICVFLFEV